MAASPANGARYYKTPDGRYYVIDPLTESWVEANAAQIADPLINWDAGQRATAPGNPTPYANTPAGQVNTIGNAQTRSVPAWAHMGPTAPGAFTFGNLDNKQDIAYNTPGNYGVGYQKLTDWANPNNSSSNYGSWLASQAGEVQNRYNDAAFRQGTDAQGQGLKWVDYLEQQAPGFRNMFNSLSARGRGENPALYESGVYLG